MRFPTKAKCREWLATFQPDEAVGLRSRPSECPTAKLVRYAIGDMPVRISVVPPVVRLFDDAKKKRVAEARIPLWATCIIIGVDMNLPRGGSIKVTAAEVTA
jgi:hypothetical protein